MIEQQIDIPTPDGRVSTFITHPERDGPHPVVLLFMDAPGIREELRDMARRLGTCGYYVMLPSLYYRAGVFELGPIPPDDDAPERKRMYELMYSLTIPMVTQDTKALLNFAAMQPAASKGPAGAVGYCMSGRYAISAAANFPDRVKAAASIYGTHLMTDAPDSPHHTAHKASGELYFACAETDRWAPPELIGPLREKLSADGVAAEVEVYPNTHHGFAFPMRPVYDKHAAERHWERVLALYRRRL
ncbi:dienelactone hydrolase [Rhodopseudomonas palustris BisB5]|uniref:Dienelactone hydrolase n=1 Tax=Rhodopseudomonas palustris (strain BisB5) TaxID=316057 RepID=Q131Z4_RHOPS|nr:dienelactone hydrolase [Rhodopseudomonas palustris BisB5]